MPCRLYRSITGIIMGKVIGLIFGLMLLGPRFGFFGVILGFCLGHWFDKGLKLNLNPGNPNIVRESFFSTLFLVMGHIAKADGRISEQELNSARATMAHLGLDENARLRAMNFFNEGKQSTFNLNEVVGKFLHHCRFRRDLLRLFIEIQLEAALAEGNLPSAKQKILLELCRQMRFSPAQFALLFARYRAEQAFHDRASSYSQQNSYQRQHQQQRSSSRYTENLQDAYGLLGIAPTVSDAEVKKAYRRLMSQYHPDKLVSKGLPPEMIQVANEKTQQIRAAYEKVRDARGMK